MKRHLSNLLQTTQAAARGWGVLCAGFLMLTHCASDGQKEKDGEPAGSASSDKAARPDNDEGDGPLKKGIVSLSGNGSTLHIADRGKAEEIANKLRDSAKSGGANEKRNLRGALAAERLAGMSLDRMIDTAKRLVEIEMKQSVERELPAEAKLELGFGALRAKRYSFAEMLFEDVRASKTPRVRAGALVGLGLLAASEDRVPEATFLWNQALKEANDFDAARFNVGFISLKYGDYKTAGRMLNGIDDIFAQYGMISVHRLAGDTKAAERLCEKVLDAKPNYKPALMNCALVEFQGNQNYAKAKQLLNRMVKASGGDPKIDEEGYKILAQIDNEAAQTKKDKPQSEGAAEKSGEQ